MDTQLQLNIAAEINRLHSELCGLARTSLEKAIRIGELLTEQKAKSKHGHWLGWVEANLQFDQRTARNYIRCFEHRDEFKSENVSDLSDAYRLLSAPGEAEVDDEIPRIEVQPENTVRQCVNGHLYDSANWNPKLSGYECPYCWAQAQNPVQPPAPSAEVPRVEIQPHLETTSENERPHVANNSGENEWYTPPEFIAAARAVMGGIDLDPASCEQANKTVGAKRFFDKETNGLRQKWSKSVWLNPPYAQPLISEFAEKVSTEFEAGNITQACVLVNNATDTVWFQRMMQAASAVCFPKGRIRFIDKRGNPSGAPLQGQAVIYFGKSTNRFVREFKQFGFVLA